MLLPVQVTFRNMDNHAGLDAYAEKEAAKLERFYNRISSCRVMVERPQKAASSKMYHVRIDLGVPNGELVVKHPPSLRGTLQQTPKRAIHEAFQEMGRRLQDYARRQEGAVKTRQRIEEAVIKEIFPAQGYGFLETADGRELYFHQASVLDGHFAQLRTGARVAFDQEMGDKGPQVTTLKMIHPRKQARSSALVAELPAKQR